MGVVGGGSVIGADRKTVCHKAKRSVGVLYSPSYAAVLPDKALYLPTFSHLLIVNKLLSLS
jgi:hypothetical protein